jgi:hypothetical protein
MSRHDYANARDVLPSEVLSLVQRHYAGILYIPVPSPNQDRDEKIRELYQQGQSVGRSLCMLD